MTCVHEALSSISSNSGKRTQALSIFPGDSKVNSLEEQEPAPRLVSRVNEPHSL